MHPEAKAARPFARPARRFRTVRTIVALMLREMQTSYGRTAGGYAWALLEPIGGIALFTWIVSVGFRIREPAIGTNFPLFFATGMLMLTMFNGVSGKVAQSLNFSRPLLFYPGVAYTDALVARFALAFLTQILVLYIVFGGIYAIFDLPLLFDVRALVAGVALTGLLALGIGTLNCFLFNFFPLWGNLWAILTTPLFIISTVFYAYEDIPREYQDIAWWNPIIHVVGLMRRGVYPTYDAGWISPFYVGCVGAFCLVMGLLFLHRFHRDFINR
jgi:capsular polysaccharide transport system permease protein